MCVRASAEPHEQVRSWRRLPAPLAMTHPCRPSRDRAHVSQHDLKTAHLRFPPSLLPLLSLLPPCVRAQGHVSCAQWLSLSEGTVAIRDRLCTTQPTVDERMLSSPSDLARMVHGVRQLARLLHSDHFKRITHEIVSPAGSPQDVLLMPDAVLRASVLDHSADAQHATGTCRLGRVVDNECVVLGVGRLRVIDCSIMPAIVRANTYLTALAIGEKMASVLKASRRKPRTPASRL